MKCESLPYVDVRLFVREGVLKNQDSFECRWTAENGSSGNMRIWVYESGRRIEVHYREGGRLVRQSVQLEYTPCRFGGERVWFRCPMAGCNRRATTLYLGVLRCACRTCFGLAYQSQFKSPVDRAIAQAWKIRRRLGAKPGLQADFPAKPKGMHWSTYERLRQRSERYLGNAEALFAPRLKNSLPST